MTTKRLYRSGKDKILGGVAGGLGEYFEVDPTLIRLVFALAFLSGFGFLAYILAWIIVPMDPKFEDKKPIEVEIEESIEKLGEDLTGAVQKGGNVANKFGTDFRFWAGLVLVFFATSLLLQNIFGFGLWQNFWPVILIALGFVLVLGSVEKK